MKLRIRGDAIRLRLTQKEVNSLADGQPILASTNFPGGSRFVYAVETSKNAGEITATFEDNILKVLLPMVAALTWAKSEEVSLQFKHPLAAGGELFILVEKDFTCLKTRDHAEDESDMFPNPNEKHGHCT